MTSFWIAPAGQNFPLQFRQAFEQARLHVQISGEVVTDFITFAIVRMEEGIPPVRHAIYLAEKSLELCPADQPFVSVLIDDDSFATSNGLAAFLLLARPSLFVEIGAYLLPELAG